MLVGSAFAHTQGTASLPGAVSGDEAPPAAAATHRIRPGLLKGLDSAAAAQEPQSALVEAVEGLLSSPITAKMTDGAAILPSLNRAPASDGRPCHLTVKGILTPSFSASSSPRSCSVPTVPLPTYRATGTPEYQRCAWKEIPIPCYSVSRESPALSGVCVCVISYIHPAIYRPERVMTAVEGFSYI